MILKTGVKDKERACPSMASFMQMRTFKVVTPEQVTSTFAKSLSFVDRPTIPHFARRLSDAKAQLLKNFSLVDLPGSVYVMSSSSRHSSEISGSLWAFIIGASVLAAIVVAFVWVRVFGFSSSDWLTN